MQLTDAATVTGRVNPTGGQSVRFDLYGPDNVGCSGTALFSTTAALTIDGAQSDATTPPVPGVYRWRATYLGDASNLPVTGDCGLPSETVTVTQALPTIATTASPNITIGGQLSDQATVTGRVSPVGSQTVTFRLYGPDDTSCAGPAVLTEIAALVNSNAVSTTTRPATAGVYRWRATYDGDANNAPVTGACGELSETRTVAKATPAITTFASPNIVFGGQLFDTATVSGLVDVSAGSNITFLVYGPDDAACTGPPAFSSQQTVIPNAALTSATAQSASFTPAAVGLYRWRATFNGDVNNAAVAGVCNAVEETRRVSKTTPALSPQASPDIALGAGPITATATVAGVAAVPPTGVATFQLFGPDDRSCTGGSIFTDQRALGPDGPNATATSAPFSPTAVGVYRWRLIFGGDANYDAVVTACDVPNSRVTATAAGTAPPPAPPAPPAPPPAAAEVAPPAPPAAPAAPAAAPTCNGRAATIVAAGGAVVGTAGADVIVGTAARDVIDGRGGEDTICAAGGDDDVRGGAGRDIILGGDGDDRLRGDGGSDRIVGGAGADLLRGGAGNDDLRGGTGRDRAAGDDGDDRVDGESGDDNLDDQGLGGNGRDRLFGGKGNDRVRTKGRGADVVDCGTGLDSVQLDRSDRQKRCERLRR